MAGRVPRRSRPKWPKAKAWRRPRVRHFVPASRNTTLAYTLSGTLTFGGGFAYLLSLAPRAAVHRAGVFVHSPWWPGERICELTTAHNVDRHFERMAPGNAALHISREDPAIDADTLQRGNKLVIKAADMPDWVGTIITLTESLQSGEIEITAIGEAAVLDARIAPQGEEYTSSTGPDTVFRSLVTTANARSHTGVFLPARLGLGPSIEDLQVGGQSVMQAMNELHNRTDYEWWVESVATPQHIRSEVNWGYQQGEDVADSVHLWQGIHFGEFSYKLDLSHVKDVVVATGSIGTPLGDRNSVARTGSRGPGRVDIGTTSVLSESTAAVRSIQDLPPGLRNERHMFEVTTDSLSELSRRAQRAFERPFASGELFTVQANRAADWSQLRVGNYITVHASLGLGDLDRKVRIVALQPDEERGEVELLCEVPLR